MENNNDFIKDWLEGKISPEELKSKKESGDKLVNEVDELITRSSHLSVPEMVSKEEAWKKFTARVAEAPKPSEAKVVKMNRWIPVSIAASVSLLVIAFFVFGKTVVSTEMAETRVHILPDGSEVTLNADSKLSFRKTGWSSNRIVSLEGEAFFDVKKGNSFIVETENGTVTVLGTSFNVNARSTYFSVACYTGKVNVASSEKSVVITKGLKTKLENGTLTDALPFDDQKTTWRDGEFHFDNQPLQDVFDEMARQFNVEIVYTETTPRRYTGTFRNKNIDEALFMVVKPMQLTIRRENNRIIIQ
jgi:transmembrane sensor